MNAGPKKNLLFWGAGEHAPGGNQAGDPLELHLLEALGAQMHVLSHQPHMRLHKYSQSHEPVRCKHIACEIQAVTAVIGVEEPVCFNLL